MNKKIRTWVICCVGDIADGSDKIIAAGPWYKHGELEPIEVIHADDHKQIVDRLEKRIEKLREALEFYAKPESYEYNKTQGKNYMWNDQGLRARQALKEDSNEET